MNFILIILLYLSAISQAEGGKLRIIGGQDANPSTFPHQVSLQVGLPPIWPYEHFCGGSIIDENWILTAAHCLETYKKYWPIISIVAKAGKHDLNRTEENEQTVKVKTFYIHKKYETNATAGNYDIALLELTKPLNLTDQVLKISLPEKNSEPSGNVTLSGWGAISDRRKNSSAHDVNEDDEDDGREYPTILQSVTVPIIDRKTCLDAIIDIALEMEVISLEDLEDEDAVPDDLVNETNICTGPITGGISACNGDSGGPLISKNKEGQDELIGVISYVVDYCGRVGSPTVYVKVSSFIDWIDKIMSKNK